MHAKNHLVLPDRWRVELLRRPAERDVWLNILDVLPWVILVDWESPRIGADDAVLIVELDLAAAELVLKLPPETVIIGVRPSLAWYWLGGRTQLLRRAWSRVQHPILAPGGQRDLPPSPAKYLDALLRAAGIAPC